MKKIVTSFIIILHSILSYANPGDTTIVPIHINDSLSYYGTYSHTVQLPITNVTYRKIFFIYTIGKYQCPNGSQYCGQWDYSLDFIAKPLNASIATDEFEIARGITPYALYGTYFPWAWTHSYIIDVTDFSPILKDSLQLKAQYSGYSGGFTLASKLMYIEGTPEKEAVAVQKVYKGYFGYGDTSNAIENALKPDTLSISAPATNADLLVAVTGHGSDNNGCSEFCQKYYNIKLNGAQHSQKTLWKKCGFADIQAQTGTWVFDRGNWCPGEKVLANRHPLGNFTASVPFVVDMDMETYNGSNGGAGMSVAASLISYKNPSFTLDAELDDIISPSTKDDYKKFNSNCNQPMVVIKNGGTTPLTSATITYGYKNQVQLTYQWSGNLNFLDTAIVTLPSIPWGNQLADSSSFSVRISNPNNSTDQYAANDTMYSLYRVTPALPSEFIIRLKTNNTSLSSGGSINETSWQLFNQDGLLIKERINNPHNTILDDTVKLEPMCYSLVCTDAGWEDGLNWWFYPNYGTQSPGVGYVQLKSSLTGGIISNAVTKFNSKYYGGDFGSKFIYNFKVDAPSFNPVIEKVSFECNVYPNPASDFIQVELIGTSSNTTISLIDIYGKEVYTTEKTQHGKYNIDVTALAKGVYIVKVATKSEVVLKKVTILH